MKKVVEKVQRENEQLKKASGILTSEKMGTIEEENRNLKVILCVHFIWMLSCFNLHCFFREVLSVLTVHGMSSMDALLFYTVNRLIGKQSNGRCRVGLFISAVSKPVVLFCDRVITCVYFRFDLLSWDAVGVPIFPFNLKTHSNE